MPEVVLVERDPRVRAAVQARLEVEGYAVTTVADGVAMLRLLRERPWPQLVLVGHLTPAMRLETLLQQASETADLRQHVFVVLGCRRHDWSENPHTGLFDGLAVFAVDCPECSCSDPYQRCEFLATLDEAERCVVAS